MTLPPLVFPRLVARLPRALAAHAAHLMAQALAGDDPESTRALDRLVALVRPTLSAADHRGLDRELQLLGAADLDLRARWAVEWARTRPPRKPRRLGGGALWPQGDRPR